MREFATAKEALEAVFESMEHMHSVLVLISDGFPDPHLLARECLRRCETGEWS